MDWDPRSLAEGDVLGLLVTASEGELLIFRNGAWAAKHINIITFDSHRPSARSTVFLFVLPGACSSIVQVASSC